MSKFESEIPAGNLFEMTGAARRFMRQMGVSNDEIEALTSRVANAPSYVAACAEIEAWFPITKE